MVSFKSRIYDLIKNNDLKQAIEEVLTYLNQLEDTDTTFNIQSKKDDLTAIEARLNDYHKSSYLGVMSFQELNIEKAKLTHNLIQFVSVCLPDNEAVYDDTLSKTDVQNQQALFKKSENNQNRRQQVLYLIGFLVYSFTLILLPIFLTVKKAWIEFSLITYFIISVSAFLSFTPRLIVRRKQKISNVSNVKSNPNSEYSDFINDLSPIRRIGRIVFVISDGIKYSFSFPVVAIAMVYLGIQIRKHDVGQVNSNVIDIEM